MGNRQQTMAKLARERSVRERRERKEEKKRQKKLAAAEQSDPKDEELDLASLPSDTPTDTSAEPTA